jgi:flagellar biosynthesis GTPase FlhF
MFTWFRNLNIILILRDLMTLVSLRRSAAKEKVVDKTTDLSKGRFEVIPIKSIKDDYTSRFKADANEGPSGKRVTGDNYKQMYLEQRAREQEKADANKRKAEAAKREGSDAAAKAAADKKKENDQRSRARTLQDQIAWWQQQHGAGQYEEPVINSMITNLQSELNGIPQRLWQ